MDAYLFNSKYSYTNVIGEKCFFVVTMCKIVLLTVLKLKLTLPIV